MKSFLRVNKLPRPGTKIRDLPPQNKHRVITVMIYQSVRPVWWRKWKNEDIFWRVVIPTIHGFSPPGEVQLCLMGGGVKGPGKAPAPSKLKKEVVVGGGCSEKLRQTREPEKLPETEAAATASASTSNGAENIKRKSRLEVKMISLSLRGRDNLHWEFPGWRERTQPLSRCRACQLWWSQGRNCLDFSQSYFPIISPSWLYFKKNWPV